MDIDDLHADGSNARVAQDVFHVSEWAIDTVHAILAHDVDDSKGTLRRLPDDGSVRLDGRTDVAGTQDIAVFLHQLEDFGLAQRVIATSEDVDARTAQLFKRRPGHTGPMGRVLGVGHDDRGPEFLLELRKQSPYNRTPRTPEDITDEQQRHEQPLPTTWTAKALATEGQRIWSD
jgi:hypothetical protein